MLLLGLIALLVSGLILAGLRRRRRVAWHEADTLAARIVPPVYKPGMTMMDDRLRVRSLARRQAADSLKARARHVDSGSPVSQILRRVK